MNAPHLRLISVLACGLGLTAAALAQTPKVEFPRPSPVSTLKQRVGLTDIEIKYSRPGVKGREVFGDQMEKFGVVWRTGANESTTITFSKPVKFGGHEIAAGKYALFSIPDPTEWTVILNKTPAWGAYTYDEKNDVLRVKVKSVHLAESVETFTIDVNDIRDSSATLDLIWQHTKVPVPLEFNTVAQVSEQIETAMAEPNKPDARLDYSAAEFYFNNSLDLQKAASWIDAAIAQKPSFGAYYLKARILAKTGDKAGAKAAAEKSIELLANEKGAVKDEYLQKNHQLIDDLAK